MNVVPDPATLGLFAPTLGPWFGADITLPAPPAGVLSVPFTVPAQTAFFPPAPAIMSVYINTAARPPALARLRDPTEADPFQTGNAVILLELLPETWLRMEQLLVNLPSFAAAPTNNTPTRTTVRTLALELPAVSDANLVAHLPTAPFQTAGTTDADLLQLFGLTSFTANAPDPMSRLVRPGVDGPLRDRIATLQPGTNYVLHAFDDAGRAMDPGAVAAWWNALATLPAGTPQNLWAAGITGGERRTCTVAPSRICHLVNPHEGPVSAVARGRLTLTGNMTVNGANNAILTAPQTTATSVTAPGDPATAEPNPAPVMRVGVLPEGPYAVTVNLWQGRTPAVHPLRDYVRVGMVSIENFLVGRARNLDRWQREPSSRTTVGTTAPGVLHRGADVTAGAIVGLPQPALVAAEALDRRWGPFVPATALPQAPTPARPDITVEALVGGGDVVSGVATDQDVLVRFSLPAAYVGAWVRLWAQGLDLRTGDHVRLPGGAAQLVANNGVAEAYVVVRLEDGDPAPPSKMGLDLQILNLNAQNQVVESLFRDLRFERPAPLGGVPVVIAGNVASDTILCETGQRVPAGSPLPPASVPSGAHGVSLATPPALVDTTQLPAGVSGPVMAGRVGDTIVITPPPFRAQPTGDIALAAGPASVTVRGRGFDPLTAGQPLPSMARRELLAVDPAATTAVIGTGPARAAIHETPTHRLGHPQVPAAAEHHASGATLTSQAAWDALEYALDFTNPSWLDLWNARMAMAARPAALASPTPWASVLRTTAAYTEAGMALSGLTTMVQNDLPIGDDTQSIIDFLVAQGIAVPPVLTAAQNAVRGVERRLVRGALGANEVADVLTAAVSRAEDLVWIETPAFDALQLPGRSDWFAALVARMTANPNVGVVFCVPRSLDEGAPPALQRVRNTLVWTAWQQIANNAALSGRAALVSPATGPGRSLRLGGAAVVVDEAWALVGSTALWRRGLTFDSSLAVAVFDENLTNGRPTEIVNVARTWIADRLGLALVDVPRSGRELAALCRQLEGSGGQGRLAVPSLGPPDPNDSVQIDTTLNWTPADFWNPDGGPQTTPQPLLEALKLALPTAYDDLEDELTPQT